MNENGHTPPAWRVRLYAAAVERLPFLRYVILRRRFLADSGWRASMRAGAPVDAQGCPVPWYTYAALHFLDGRVHGDMDVFEYGAGYSTLWWAARARSVCSVESDQGWVAKLAPQLPPNAELRYEPGVENGRYARLPLERSNAYDVVVIDGMDRNGCAVHAVKALKPDGVIVWDNADWRDMYADGLALLDSEGFRRLDFAGLGPLNGIGWTTAVFYRPEANCLGI